MIDYVALFFGCAFLAMTLLWWRLHQKLKCWHKVFTGLSNAERVLLMWPSMANGRPVRQLTFQLDRSDDGFARLCAGPQVLAKLPLKAAIKGQKDLKELVSST